MNILKKYADEQGYNYQELLSDFYSSPRHEQDMFMAQLGGEVQQAPQQPQGQDDQVMQIIQAFAQLTGEDPQAIMQQLQQLPPEEQQAAIQEMVQAIQSQQQQAQMGGRYGLKKKSLPITTEGYRVYNPESTPQLIVPSGNISMEGINYPIRASDADTGEYLGDMQPGQQYKFNATNILEEPIYAQKAGAVNKNIVKVDKSFVYFTDGTKMPVQQFKAEYTDNMENLNRNAYDTEQRRETAKFINQFNQLAPKTVTPKATAINPITGKVDPATGYWDRALNYREDNIDPRATRAEEKILPFYGEQADGVLDWGVSTLTHLQKKGNQLLTGYYEAPSKTVNRYKNADDKLDKTEKFALDVVTDPALLIDFGPAAIKGAAPHLVKAAKATSELVGKYGSKAAEYIAKYGGKAAAYIGKYGLKGLEAAFDFTAKHGETLSKASTVKSQLAKLGDEDEEDPYKQYFKKVADAKQNSPTGNLSTSPNYLGLSPAVANTTGKTNTALQPSKTNFISSAAPTGTGATGNVTVKGKNRTYNLKPIVASNPNKPLFRDEDGTTWQKGANGYTVVPKTGNSVKTNIADKPLVGGKGKVKSKVPDKVAAAPVTSAVTPKLNFLPKDTDLTDKEIEEIAQAVPGAVAPATAGPRDLTLENLGGEKNWLGGQSVTTVGSAPEPTTGPSKNPQYKFNTRNMLQGIVAQQNVAKAFQPIALPFRQHVQLEAPQAKFIDENVVLAPIMQAFEKTVSNINPNSTTGMAFKSNLFGKLTETIPTVLNDVNVKNQQIHEANQVSLANARNQEQQINIGADNKAYQDMLGSYANRDAAILKSLEGVSNLEVARAEKDALIDGYKIENPFINETSSFLDKMFGTRTLEVDPEYRKIYKTNRILAEQEKEKAALLKK
jgi:hypothetical protein